MDDNRKEIRRENKQVRSLKRLRTMQSKGKTGTKRFNRLKEKVYNPFPDESPLSLKDACYYKAKKAHKVFPSAYASGMIAKCRKNKGK